MGAEYSCQTLESEEETVNKIFKDMFKKEFQSGAIYENFLNCIIFNPQKKKIKLSKKLLISLLEYAIEDNRYKEVYINYIINFIPGQSEIDSIRKIGLILIDLSINKDLKRKKFYLDHFKRFYLDMHKNKDKDNDKDVNNTNENIFDIKRSSSEGSIINKNEERDTKFTFIRINSNENNFSKEKEVFNFEEIEGDFDYNNMNQSNFMNFYKKKEMENLDMQIKQLISDIIEINTDSINSIIGEILSKPRGDILKNSWGKNNKKLLLFEIHRNYTSLVEKILCSTKSQRKNSLIPNTARNTFNYSRKSISRNDYNSSPVIQIEKSETSTNTNGDDDNKKIVKEELIEFKKMENKIIKNFFDLSETQISGDAVRDWLYESSKD